VLTLKNVAYAPDIAVNVVSCSLMEMAGFKLVTYQGKVQSFYDDELVSEAVRNLDGLYHLQAAKSSQLFVSIDDWTTELSSDPKETDGLELFSSTFFSEGSDGGLCANCSNLSESIISVNTTENANEATELSSVLESTNGITDH